MRPFFLLRAHRTHLATRTEHDEKTRFGPIFRSPLNRLLIVKHDTTRRSHRTRDHTHTEHGKHRVWTAIPFNIEPTDNPSRSHNIRFKETPMSFKIEFPGSATAGNRTRTASLELRSVGQKIQVGFRKSQNKATKVKFFDIEDVEVLMTALMEHQGELAEMIGLATEAVAKGMTIKDGEIVAPKEEPKPAPTPAPAPKRFSLSTPAPTPTPTPAPAPAPAPAPTPEPKATKSVGSSATTAAEVRRAKMAEIRAKMGR